MALGVRVRCCSHALSFLLRGGRRCRRLLVPVVAARGGRWCRHLYPRFLGHRGPRFCFSSLPLRALWLGVCVALAVCAHVPRVLCLSVPCCACAVPCARVGASRTTQPSGSGLLSRASRVGAVFGCLACRVLCPSSTSEAVRRGYVCTYLTSYLSFTVARPEWFACKLVGSRRCEGRGVLSTVVFR